MLCPDCQDSDSLCLRCEGTGHVCDQCDAPAAQRGADLCAGCLADDLTLPGDCDPTGDLPEPLLPAHMRVVGGESLRALED